MFSFPVDLGFRILVPGSTSTQNCFWHSSVKVKDEIDINSLNFSPFQPKSFLKNLHKKEQWSKITQLSWIQSHTKRCRLNKHSKETQNIHYLIIKKQVIKKLAGPRYIHWNKQTSLFCQCSMAKNKYSGYQSPQNYWPCGIDVGNSEHWSQR